MLRSRLVSYVVRIWRREKGSKLTRLMTEIAGVMKYNSYYANKAMITDLSAALRGPNYNRLRVANENGPHGVRMLPSQRGCGFNETYSTARLVE